MDICSANRRVGTDVAAFLRNVSALKEESITDYLLWRWKEIDPRFKYFKATPFNRHEESTTGADLEIELWLVGAVSHLPMIVQAKKLWKPFDSYVTRLNYPSGTQVQLTNLLAYASTHRRVPFYLLYALPETKTRTKCCREKVSDGGVFLADALAMKHIADGHRGRRVSRSDLLAESTPFHCLFCCPQGAGGEAVVRHVGGYLEAPYLRSNEELPDHVRMLLEGELPLEPDWAPSSGKVSGDEEGAMPRILAAYDAREGFDGLGQVLNLDRPRSRRG